MMCCRLLIWKCLVTFVLLTPHTSYWITVAGMSVDPPENITIIDPGHLGQLNIEWSRPNTLQDLSGCTVQYQLRYYDTYTERWKSVRTLRLSYTAQFDLEKPVQLRMLTLLKGACTNGTEVLGKEVELVHAPEHAGVPGTRIRDFGCVYFNNEYMECMWEPGTAEPADSKRYLYYWHREMQETEECPEYIPSPEHRRGCRFPSESLLDFSEFNICVNGSSEAGSLKPAFFSLAVQNHVKPAAVSDIRVSLTDTLLWAEWEPPTGPVPEQCLEYEFEMTTVSHDGREQKQLSVIEETTVEFRRVDENERNCLRVRSRVNTYCADEGFWSDWSQPRCIPDTEPERIDPKPLWNTLPFILASTLAVVLVICVALWMFTKMLKNRGEDEHVLCSLYQEKVRKAISPIFSPVI